MRPYGNTAIPLGNSAPGKTSDNGKESNSVFRALYYAADYAGLAGKDLSEPVDVVPEENVNDQDQLSGQQGRNRQTGIPQNAIDACVGLSEGVTCQADTPEWTA